ncbi:sigma factor-like helix-turn-helix DNA-binding protein [Rhizobium sp. RM]|nr:sigma factor-like helix-turn-helix DNA-binding protein [Rhizobium sp. RM]
MRLPQPYRTAFNLIFIEGVSYDAAAERFGCPIGTIKAELVEPVRF